MECQKELTREIKLERIIEEILECQKELTREIKLERIIEEIMECQKELTREIKLERIIEQIFEELREAGIKFPGFPEDVVHAGSIVAEEAGELLKACNEYTYENGPKKNLIKEAVQTGAMAIRFLFNLDQMIKRKSKMI